MAFSQSIKDDPPGSLMSSLGAKDKAKRTDTSTRPLQTSVIEALLIGEDSPEAGFWATRAKECPWQKARGPKKRPSEKIYTLITLFSALSLV